MATTSSVPTSLDGVTSLYRRFRPGRFAELRGQEHIVRALQGAVARDRVAHAYLFSGPRGTGKTTTARILAKALNCEDPTDGDACNVCASCVAITKGTSLDVQELDAASNNGVDAIRQITSGSWHGTTGRWKIYVLDEVHMLSKSASAALLKTLEEPPAHVIFVLATTDPHKVLPTIRSRTQHLEFRLLPSDTLSTLLHDVQGAAGLEADDTVIEAAVRQGRGSARDALSALDQLLATGTADEARPQFDGLLEAVVSQDAGLAIQTLAALLRDGWDAEQLAESFASDVRQIFLLQVAPEVADVADTERDRLSAWGQQLGLAKTVRTLETFGKTMRDMKSAPDKVILLEVCVVRIVRPDLDRSMEALDERIAKLERLDRSGASVVESPAPPPVRPIGADNSVSAAPRPAPAPVVAPTPQRPPTPAPDPVATPAPTTTDDASDPEGLRRRFEANVIAKTPRAAQMVLAQARIVEFDGRRMVLSVVNAEIRLHAEAFSGALKSALDHEFKTPITVQWVIEGEKVQEPTPSAPEVVTPPVDEDDEVDFEDDATASVTIVDSAAAHLITELFPGAEELS